MCVLYEFVYESADEHQYCYDAEKYQKILHRASLEKAVLDFSVHIFALDLDVRIDPEEDFLDGSIKNIKIRWERNALSCTD